MKEQKYAGGIAARRQGPFGWHAIGVDRFEVDVRCKRSGRTDGVEPFAALGESRGPGLGAQQFANSIDLAAGHVQILRVGDALSCGRPLSRLTANQRRSSGAARRGLGAGAAAPTLVSKERPRPVRCVASAARASPKAWCEDQRRTYGEAVQRWQTGSRSPS